MQVTAILKPDQGYACETQMRHHTYVVDVDTKSGGKDSGPTPHEFMLASLATCTAMVIRTAIRKNKLTVKKVTVTVSEGKTDDPDDTSATKKQIPHIVEDIKIEGTLTAAELDTLKKAGETCPMLKLFTGKKVVESKIAGVP